MDKDNRLKLAVQKSGRLTDHSLDLLGRCGLKLSRGKDQLMGFGENLPLDVLFVRDDDIPDLVQEDVCDLGLVGLNVLEERRLEMRSRGAEARFEVLRPLDFGHCRLSIAVPEGAVFNGLGSLQDARIATTYPALLADFLARHEIRAEIVHAVGRGGDRAAPRSGRCDLRSRFVGLHAAGQPPARGPHHPAQPGGADPHADEAQCLQGRLDLAPAAAH